MKVPRMKEFVVELCIESVFRDTENHNQPQNDEKA